MLLATSLAGRDPPAGVRENPKGRLGQDTLLGEHPRRSYCLSPMWSDGCLGFPTLTGHSDLGLSLPGFSLSSSVKLSKAFLEEPCGDLSILPVYLVKKRNGTADRP